MKEALDLLLKVSVPAFLLSSMLGAGAGLAPRDLLAPLRNPRLLAGALAANFVAAPALAYLLSLPLRPAHAAGLLVHPFTFHNEQYRLVSDFRTNPVNEYVRFYELGVDGLFSDFTDTARVARYTFLLKTRPELAECLTGEVRGKGACKALAD